MNLYTQLRARADRPVRVGLIGADKFGAMFLAQVARPRNAVAADAPVPWADVEIDETAPAVRLRREMERAFAPAALGA